MHRTTSVKEEKVFIFHAIYSQHLVFEKEIKKFHTRKKWGFIQHKAGHDEDGNKKLFLVVHKKCFYGTFYFMMPKSSQRMK